jgi:hypothetical protein
MTSVTFSYSTELYPFSRIVGNMLDCHNLMFLHEQLSELPSEVFQVGRDQETYFHSTFYRLCAEDSDFMRFYRNLIYNYVDDEREFLYQAIPTFRVHLPGNKAVGGISHRDSDYNHPKKEVNFLVPLTSMFDSNSMFKESKPGLRDFKFVNLKPGDMLRWDGANCEHGNIPNTTGVTRVSFDFRVIYPEDLTLEDQDRSTVAYGSRFRLGEYYRSSSELG